MFGSEWWSFEIVSLMAGRLGETSIAAQAAITSSKCNISRLRRILLRKSERPPSHTSLNLTVDIFLAMIPYAAGLATTVRLGQLLGHNTPQACRAATSTVRAAYTFTVAVTACLATGLFVGRFWLAGVYVKGDGESEKEVRALIASVLIPIAL